jgi:hypothetical protein
LCVNFQETDEIKHSNSSTHGTGVYKKKIAHIPFTRRSKSLIISLKNSQGEKAIITSSVIKRL